MKLVAVSLLGIGVFMQPALADDWASAPLVAPVQGKFGPTGATNGNSYQNSFGGYTTATTERCAPSNGPGPCLPGEAVAYEPGNYPINFTAGIPGAASASPNVGLDVNGFYADPSSPSGISYFNGRIPLSQFASSSALSNFQTQFSNMIQDTRLRADQGTSMALAMAGVPDLQQDEHFAVSMNFGTFRGQTGQAIGVAYRIADHFSVNGGAVASLNGGGFAGRAGFRFGW